MEPGSVTQSPPAQRLTTQAVDPTVAAITHELRTPLQAIIGFTQLALLDWPAGADPHYLHQIEQASRMMLRSVNDLLDLSHLERRTLQIEPDQDLDLGAVFAELQATGDSLRQDKGLTLAISLDPACPRHLRGDAKRIQQVLQNLLANAIRFTDRGRVMLQARVLVRQPGAVRVRLSVSDTGIGMPAADLAQLLEPADDGLPALEARRSGTGFGLRIVRQLLALMGARLHGVSVSGGGTLLWFDLCLPHLTVAPPEAGADAAAITEVSGLPHDPILQGMRVLVVEDNSLNRLVLCDVLQRLGLVTEVAVDAQAARERLALGELDAMVCDMQLPDGSGLSVLRWLRQQTGPQAHLPTLFLSAHVSGVDRRSADALGAEGCLLKPHDPHALVRHLVRMRRARDEPVRVTPRTAAGLEALSGVNLTALFLSEWPALRMAIQRAEAVDTLRRAVHAVRGSLAVLGPSDALRLARELEEALLAGSEPQGLRVMLIRAVDAIEAAGR